MTNLELVVDYLHREYQTTKRQFGRIDEGDSIWSEKDKPMIVNQTIQRGLGAVMFAQSLDGVKYETIEPIYEQYKENLEKLLTD